MIIIIFIRITCTLQKQKWNLHKISSTGTIIICTNRIMWYNAKASNSGWENEPKHRSALLSMVKQRYN